MNISAQEAFLMIVEMDPKKKAGEKLQALQYLRNAVMLKTSNVFE